MKQYLSAVPILIAVIMIAAGCTGTKTPTPEELRDVKITLERTECFGTCPVCKLTVYGDGRVVYEGIRFVKVEGIIKTKISEDKIKQLVSEFNRIDYFSLDSSYEELNATDMPSAITSYTVNGKTKTVRHYHGDLSAPKKLAQLENRIDEIVGSEQWVNRYPQ